jgi:uncharacterized protein YkwD
MRTAVLWLVLTVVASGLSWAQRPDTANAMLEAVNAERRVHGVGALVLDKRLVAAAAEHAHDLVATGQFTHEGSDGSRVGDRVERAGYRWTHVAENLASTSSPSAAAVVRDWMRSAPHRKNVLDRSMTAMGAARAGHIWVLVLAR